MSKHNFNRNFAIIIGINNYKNGIRKLETAKPDARKLAEIIKKQHQYLKVKYQKQNEYKVQLLLNEEANFDQLKDLIEDFKQGQIPLDNEKVTVTKDDRLLFYFAGHGIALDALENQEGPVGYLIPQDATSGESSTYLPMQYLHDALNALPCRHMLAILDCCFAGAFRWASLKREIVPKVKVYKERYDRFISDRAWQVITSGADDQTVVDSLGLRGRDEENHSPFAKALFDALCGKDADFNKDGIITATELYLYLRDRVDRSENRYKRQTPGLYPLRKQDKGEFIFLLPDFDRDKLDDAPELNPENNPYRGLQPYDEEHSHLFFGRENLIKKLYQKVVDHKQAFTVVLGASGTGKSSLMKAGLLKCLRDSREDIPFWLIYFFRWTVDSGAYSLMQYALSKTGCFHQFKILNPMRPGEIPLKALARVCLPITDEPAAEKFSAIKQLSQELKKSKPALEKLIKNCKNFNTELLQAFEQLTLRDDLLDIEHLKFTDKLQQSLRDIFSNNNDTEKQLVNRWINKFNKRKQLHEELKKPIEDLSKALKQETHLTTIIKSWSSSHSNTKLLLPVDQFEELITLCKSDAEREQFQKSILNAIAKYPDKIHVVITLRLDFEAQFQNSVLQDFWNDDTRFVVPPMTQDELREVIEKPALEKVLYFDPPSLVDELINEVVQMPGALPLLSFTLSELYLKYSGDRTRDNRALTKKDYEELERVVGSITKRANQEYKKLVGDSRFNNVLTIWLLLREIDFMASILFLRESLAYKNTIRRVMLRMISLQGGELARRQVPKDELVYPDKEENKRVAKVIKSFSEARLIVEGSNPQGDPYVEPAHDALVEGWDKLLVWKKENEEILILQQRLTPAAEEWENIEQSSNRVEIFINLLDKTLDLIDNFFSATKTQFARLLRRNSQEEDEKTLKKSRFLWDTNPRLNLLKEVLNSSDNWLSKTEAEFVQSSINQSRRNTAKGLSITTGGILLLGGLAYGISFLIREVNSNLADTYMNRSRAAVQTKRYNEAALLAAEALKYNKENIAARKIILENPAYGLLAVLPGHPGGVNSIAFSPDGRLIASGGEDRKIRIWDAYSGQEKISSPDQSCDIEYIKFSPDGKLLASSCSNGQVSLWEIPSLTKRGNITKPSSSSLDVQFIPIRFTADSSTLITALEDSTIRFWDVDSRKEKNVKKISVNQDRLINDIELDRDSNTLAYISNYELTLWDIKANKKLWSKSTENYLNNVIFSHNQELIAIGTEENSILIWNREGELKKTLFLPVTGLPFDSITKIIFGNDDSTILASKPDGSVVIFEWEKGSVVQIIPASEDGIAALALHPDGTIAATGADEGNVGNVDDHSIRLWDLTSRHQRAVLKHTERYSEDRVTVETLDISPSNDELAVATRGGEIYFWDIPSQTLTKKVIAVDDNELSVKWLNYNKNENTLVSISDHSVRVWNSNNYDFSHFIGDNLHNLETGATTSDGKLLATMPTYGFVQFWDLSPGDAGVHNREPFEAESYKKILFSPSDKELIILTDLSDQLLIRDIETQKVRPFSTGHSGSINDFAISNSELLATADSGSIFVWSYPDNEEPSVPHEISQGALRLLFSPNSQLLASATSDRVQLWGVENAQAIATFEGDSIQTETLAFSSDSRLLFSAGMDGTARMWNLENLDLDATTIIERNQLLTGLKVEGFDLVPLEDWHDQAQNSSFFKYFKANTVEKMKNFSENWESHSAKNEE